MNPNFISYRLGIVKNFLDLLNFDFGIWSVKCWFAENDSLNYVEQLICCDYSKQQLFQKKDSDQDQAIKIIQRLLEKNFVIGEDLSIPTAYQKNQYDLSVLKKLTILQKNDYDERILKILQTLKHDDPQVKRMFEIIVQNL